MCARFEESVALLVEQGAEVVEVSCPNFDYALAAYYLILPSEASSNWPSSTRCATACASCPRGRCSNAGQVMATRDAGFGDEVKRRIILGTYALSSGYYDAYYGSAQKVRTLIAQDFERAYEQVDVLVSPTAPTTAFRLGDKLDDPMAMYLNDIATIPANLAGVPGMSIPSVSLTRTACRPGSGPRRPRGRAPLHRRRRARAGPARAVGRADPVQGTRTRLAAPAPVPP